jgi:hypothetical protein
VGNAEASANGVAPSRIELRFDALRRSVRGGASFHISTPGFSHNPPHAQQRGAESSAGGAVSMAMSLKTPPLCSVISHRTVSNDVALPGLRKPKCRTF